MEKESVTTLYPPGLPFSSMVQRPQHLLITLASRGYKCIFGQNLWDYSGSPVYLYKGPYVQPTEYPNLSLCYNLPRYRKDHPDENIIFYTTSGPHHVWSDIVEPYAFIYDECDNFPHWDTEAIIASKKAHRITYSATSLKGILDERRKRFPEITDHMTFVPNACDFEHWNLDLKSLDDFKPPFKVMYIGFLGEWLNYELIYWTIRKMPQCEFWFIGKFGASPRLCGSVLSLPNVVYIPHIDYADLPFYTQDADVLWIPFDVTDRNVVDGDNVFPVSRVTQHTNPIKFWEYLATGKPIVFTPMSSIVDFAATCDLDDLNLSCVSTADEAIAAISKYIDFFSQEKIRAKAMAHKNLALEHTWAKAADGLEKAIQEVMHMNIAEDEAARGAIADLREKYIEDRPESISIREKPTEPIDLL